MLRQAIEEVRPWPFLARDEPEVIRAVRVGCDQENCRRIRRPLEDVRLPQNGQAEALRWRVKHEAEAHLLPEELTNGDPTFPPGRGPTIAAREVEVERLGVAREDAVQPMFHSQARLLPALQHALGDHVGEGELLLGVLDGELRLQPRHRREDSPDPGVATNVDEREPAERLLRELPAEGNVHDRECFEGNGEVPGRDVKDELIGEQFVLFHQVEDQGDVPEGGSPNHHECRLADRLAVLAQRAA